MPASSRSLQITDRYRDTRAVLTRHTVTVIDRRWQQVTLDDLERSHTLWLATAVATIMQAQHAGLRLTAAYVAAYLASETGRVSPPAPIDDTGLIGVAEDGQPVETQLAKTLIGVKAALKGGKPPEQALAEEGGRASRLAASASMFTPRETLARQIRTHPEIVGWQRVTRGGCGACLAAAAHTHGKDEPLKVHPFCECTQEPVVRDVRNVVTRPTGPEIFAGWSREQQDQALGSVAADAVRTGRVSWPDLIATSPMERQADYITQAVIEAVEG